MDFRLYIVNKSVKDKHGQVFPIFISPEKKYLQVWTQTALGSALLVSGVLCSLCPEHIRAALCPWPVAIWEFQGRMSSATWGSAPGHMHGDFSLHFSTRASWGFIIGFYSYCVWWGDRGEALLVLNGGEEKVQSRGVNEKMCSACLDPSRSTKQGVAGQ